MKGRAGSSTQKRLRILRDDEIDALYGRPCFTPEEREEYFSLSSAESAALEQFHSIKSRIYAIIQLGYFKARQMFFVLDPDEIAEDAKYVQERYFPRAPCPDLTITKVTRLRQQRVILTLCNYRTCNAEERRHLATKARQAARVCSKPVYVFRELRHHLAEHRLVSPGYSFLQETVGQALLAEQSRLTALVRQHLTPAQSAAFQQLLEGSQGRYGITSLKREPKHFGWREMTQELCRRQQLQPLYDIASRLLPHLQISNESVAYYASLVTYYTVFRLKQLDEDLVRIYLLAFAHHRYRRLNDNLINGLIYHVRRFTDAAKAAAKERVYASRVEGNENLHQAGQVLKLFTDTRIAAQTPFQDVQAQAFGILERSKLDFVADHLVAQARFDETAFQWDHIDELALQFKRHLRPLLLAVEFGAASVRDPRIAAVQLLKAAFQKGKALGQLPADALPSRVIPDPLQRYLFAQDPDGGKRPLVDRYEFLIYRLLRNGLEAGDIFCQDSVRFQSFEDDLLDDGEWRQKERLLIDTGLGRLADPIPEQLAALEQTLERRLSEVNQRITAGKNDHFQVTRRGSQVRWTLDYPPSSESVNHPFFDQLRQVDISSVVHFVHERCRFLEAFGHILGRYVKREADDRALVACLLAWGTNLGLGKMGDVSDIGYPTLAAISENVLRPETLKEANDRVSNAIAELPIFRQYDLGGLLHSSSDGQKFETRIPTINARHSPKYFGLHKGIVSYTLVANHIPVNATIIGANEHESHYVFDLLFNNSTEIQPDVHSTDTHGANEVNFALLHVFGYRFAPRYRDLYDKVRTSLYGFKHPSQYENLVLKPIRKINTRLIIEEWENLQRIFVSLALKTTTQSIIVGKLSAYARKNKTRRALWEYDNIIRSLYLLDYIDSPPLRQNVQRALNRGENYHQLHRAVSYANFGKLRFRTEYEQHLWGECSRLLTNCIIAYNATILSHLLAHKERSGDASGAARLIRVSPVAWQHINLYGRYEFRKAPETIDLPALIQELDQIPVQPDLAV
jgi:TnpA family transposase